MQLQTHFNHQPHSQLKTIHSQSQAHSHIQTRWAGCDDVFVTEFKSQPKACLYPKVINTHTYLYM